MRKDKKVLVGFSISAQNKKYLEEKAKQECRSVSSFLDKLLSDIRFEEQKES